MQARERVVRDILHSGDQYIIPVFQRYYVWKEKNWDKLWADLHFLLASPNRHFLGSIVCVPTPGERQAGDIPAYLVIDGQQRLLTLSIILCAMRNAAKSQNFVKLANEIEENYLIHKFREEREHYKVYPRLRDRLTYTRLIDGETPTESNQIELAQKYFAQKIEEENFQNSEEDLRRLFNTVTNKLELILITLGQEDPYKIFKSLNFDGIKLGQGDLIRNHVFMKLPIDEQDTFDDTYWRPFERHFYDEHDRIDQDRFSLFFKHFLMMSGKMVYDEYIYEEFDRRHPINTLDSTSIVKQFNKIVNYMSILEGRSSHPNQDVQKGLQSLASLQITVTHPLIFSLLQLYEDNRITLVDLLSSLSAIESFIVRRQVVDLNSRRYIDWFVEMSGKLGDSPLNNLLKYLNEKEWPDDAVFKQEMLICPLYKMKTKKVLMNRIEMSLQRSSEPVDVSRCDIEHIMPQTINPATDDGKQWIHELGGTWTEIHDEWVHTVGNLTLVGNDYNKSMKAKPFSMKKPVLSGSRVYLNKYFTNVTLTAWNKHEIEQRGIALAEIACQIWAKPNIPE